MDKEAVFAGTVYQKDGSAVFGSVSVRAELVLNGKPYKVKVDSNRDGDFIAAVADLKIEKLNDNPLFGIDDPKKIYWRWPAQTRFYVNGQPVRSKFFSPEGRVILIQSQDRFLGSKNLAGGVISGRVVDGHGNGQEELKVEARIVKSSGMSWLASKDAQCRTDRRGRFVLEFRGGIEVGPLYIAGKPAREIRRKTKDGAEATIPVENKFKAGSYGLIVVYQPKLLGFF